jgi:biotin carboxylase
VTHLLLLNGGRDVPARIRDLEPGISISVIARVSVLPRLPDPRRNRRTVLLPDEASDDDWLETARWLHAGLAITRVAVFGDTDQDRWALLAADLGLPGPDCSTVEAVHNKAVMRQRLRAAGVCDLPAAIVSDADAVLAFGRQHGYPLVCKPLRGSASRGIARITGPAEAEAGWRRAAGAQLGPVLVEPFVTGTEYSVEAVSEAGEHLVVAVTEKHKEDEHFVELGHVVPATLDPEQRARIGEAVQAALTALGVRDAVTHTEVIVASDRVRIVETHLRVGGDRIGELVRDAIGVDLTTCQARLALGWPTLDEVRAVLARPSHRVAAVWFGHSDRTGTITTVHEVDQARRIPGVRAVEVLTEPGRQLSPLSSSLDRTVLARAVAGDAATALTAARTAVATVRLETASPEAEAEAEAEAALADSTGCS